jgi:hypothetical protein
VPTHPSCKYVPGFLSLGVKQLVYEVAHEWCQLQDRNLRCSGMLKDVPVCLSLLV